MTPARRQVAALACVALVVPACGGSDTDHASGAGGTGGTTAAAGRGGTSAPTGGSAGITGTGGAMAAGGNGGGSGAIMTGGAGGTGGSSAAGGSGGSTGGTSGTSGASGGTTATGGSGGTAGGSGGAAPGGAGGSGGTAGKASGGAAGASGGVGGGSSGGAGGATAGGAGKGSAGSGGGAGAPVVGDCPTEMGPLGWASVAGDGVNGTTGGLGGQTVTPTSADELTTYAASDGPLVIRIQGTFDVPKLQVSSNKTLLGIGSDATINGGVRIRGYADDMVSNVIVQNLHVNGGPTAVDDDAMQIYFAHHVWIDHSDIYDGPDGNLDITHASSWVTISWTKFRYTSAYVKPSGEPHDHRFSSLLGHSDNNADEDTGRVKVTFHHDWWGDLVIERMPRVRFGEVHVFDNYYSSADNNYCIGGGLEAHLLVQNNYFDNVKDPHRFQDDQDTAQIVASGNTYVGISDTTAKDTRGTAFTPGYSAPLAPADATLKATVMKCAGPR